MNSNNIWLFNKEKKKKRYYEIYMYFSYSFMMICVVECN